MEEYSNFYGLFGVDIDADKDELRQATNKKVKEYHPDTSQSDENAAEKFQTVKRARDILMDNEKREEYNNLGHARYVERRFQEPPKGFKFTGDGSITENEVKTPGEDDMDDLMENNYQTVADPTDDKDIIKPPDKVAKSRTSRARDKKSADESNGDTVGIIITFGRILTNDLFQLFIVILFLLAFFSTVYIFINALAMIFAMLLTLGLFYFPIFRKIFKEPFED